VIQDVLVNRLKEYTITNAFEQENVLQELVQQYVLSSLWRAKFFSHAAFHSGTCLRILFGMNRFSEDLDFVLKEASMSFEWQPYLQRIKEDCRAEGLEFEVTDREQLEKAVKKAFLKTDSIGQILNFELPYERRASRKIRIKLEVDTNAPAGALFETRYITFPVTAAITSMDLNSGFGSKSHALLCRHYIKGRDWYDFLWYASRGIVPNIVLLESALDQQGPWAGQKLRIDAKWYLDAMKRRIESVDWPAARADVERFLMSREQTSLELWTKELFLQQLEKLAEAMLDRG